MPQMFKNQPTTFNRGAFLANSRNEYEGDQLVEELGGNWNMEERR